MSPYRCTACGRTQPINFTGWRCPACTGLLGLPTPPPFDPASLEPRAPGIWRYRHTFPLPAELTPVSLGEGRTPLIPVDLDGRTIHFKHEGLNPTGAFKDRGMSVMLSVLKHIGVTTALEDSSGNAGASFAAYAARAGLAAQVYVPASAAGPKRAQIAAYGAHLIPIAGPRSQAAAAARAAAEAGTVYASHVFNPLGLAGLATTAFEIWEDLGHAPEAIILPVGHGTLLLGLQRGFKMLLAAKLISRLPRLIAVQALACAPLWAVHTYGCQGLDWVTEGETLAEGIRVAQPVRGDYVLNAIRESNGHILAVDESAIAPAHAALAQRGLFVEPTCAVVWEAIPQIPGEVVAILTGNGLKAPTL